MKNHAFLILVHKQPELLGRILKVLSTDNHHFYINVDAKNNNYELFRKETEGIANVNYLHPSVEVGHASITMLKAEITLMKAVYNCGKKYDYIHLISGQDYPLRSNEQFDRFFEHTTDSFMCYDFDQDLPKMEKYYKWCMSGWHPNVTHSFTARLFNKLRLSSLTALFWRRKPVENLSGGWQWFSWHWDVVEFAMDYLDKNPAFFMRFNHCASPDEHFFHTLFFKHLDELRIRKHYPLRYISWHPHREVESDYRPYILNELDYDYVIQSPTFFCRKVDAVESLLLLDMIDAQRNNPFDITKYSEFV